MCDILRRNLLAIILHFGSYCMVAVIVIAVITTKISIWILKQLSLCILKFLFKIFLAAIIEDCKTMENQNIVLNRYKYLSRIDFDDSAFEPLDSDDNALESSDSYDCDYETAEEEFLDEFHDAYQYARWKFPWHAVNKNFLSSLFARHGLQYKFIHPPEYDFDTTSDSTNEQMRKHVKLKKPWKKRLFHEIRRKHASGSPAEDLSIASESVESQIIEDCESKENCQRPPLNEISNERVDISLRDDYNIFYVLELLEQRAREHLDSNEVCKERLCDENSNEWVDLPVRDYSNTSFEFEPSEHRLDECHDLKEMREQLLFESDSSERVDRDISSAPLEPNTHVVTESRKSYKRTSRLSKIDSTILSKPADEPFSEVEKPKKSRKQRFLCCIYGETAD